MRIALVAPLVSPIAPPFLGGAQAILYDLAAGLAARGHDIIIFAAEGTAIPSVRTAPLQIDAAELTPLRFEPAFTDLPAGPFFTQAHHFLRIALAIARTTPAFDLVNAHAYDWPAFAFAGLLPVPVLHTIHLPNANATILDTLALLADAAPNTRLSTVSRACAATYAPRVAIETILYNGIHLEDIPYGEHADSDPYLLFAGRMAPEKGVADALDIARLSGRRLILTGGNYDDAYFANEIRPRLEPLEREGRASYLGPVSRDRLWQLMAGASAVLVPSHWQEPFGLVPCEAQAAGAPVVGYAIGALPEIVADGETGWLVPPHDVEAAAAALTRVAAISRRACRARVEQRFSLPAMLDAYERVYAQIAEAAR
jgi:glycosyltransferase involved in cell wall biosynthesis